MKKILFIDRDGTLIIEPADDPQIDSLEKLEFYPGVFAALGRISKSTDYELVMVSNQDGLGTLSFPENTFWPVQNKIITALENEGIRFSAVHIDSSFPYENKPTRKPGTGMLTPYFKPEYDLKNSFVIGDRLTDLELARNLGVKGILLSQKDLTNDILSFDLTSTCVLNASSWNEIAGFILKSKRSSSVYRKTKETEIRISLNLDGEGKSSIGTGLAFLDHMLEQLARHGLIDLDIAAKGDLHIDEHHTIEDTALTLGEAVIKALGDKRGIERYGFCLPMDDSIAQVAVDFGGRPWLVWETEFKREKIGDVPTEMFYHFFKSFADTSKCNIHIKAEGDNEHHKIEAIFKAFAKAIKMAVRKDIHSDALPTTKGTL